MDFSSPEFLSGIAVGAGLLRLAYAIMSFRELRAIKRGLQRLERVDPN